MREWFTVSVHNDLGELRIPHAGNVPRVSPFRLLPSGLVDSLIQPVAFAVGAALLLCDTSGCSTRSADTDLEGVGLSVLRLALNEGDLRRVLWVQAQCFSAGEEHF